MLMLHASLINGITARSRSEARHRSNCGALASHHRRAETDQAVLVRLEKIDVDVARANRIEFKGNGHATLSIWGLLGPCRRLVFTGNFAPENWCREVLSAELPVCDPRCKEAVRDL